MNDHEFIAAMITDYNTVAEFYDNPHNFVERQNLSEPLRKALLSDDERELAEVGINSEIYTIAMSGRHLSGRYCTYMISERFKGTALGQWADEHVSQVEAISA